MTMTWGDALFLLPEIVLSIGACLLLLGPFAASKQNGTAKLAMLGLLAITGVGVVVAGGSNGAESAALRGLFVMDGFATFFKILFLIIVAIVTLLSDDFLRETRYSAWEYYSLMAFALCGMMFMASGTHLISIYVGLELLSLSSYVLAGYFKDELRSTEAAMKYFSRRDQLGDPALRLVADLWSVRLAEPAGNCGSGRCIEARERRVRHRRDDARRGPLLQGRGGSVPCLDA